MDSHAHTPILMKTEENIAMFARHDLKERGRIAFK